MERLLVIGAAGSLGNRLIDLGKERFEVSGADHHHLIDGKDTYKFDACDRERAFGLIKEIGPDCVIDTHALTDLDYCETHKKEAWDVNVEGSRNIAEACKKAGCKYMFISTDYVFDGKKASYSETDETRPLNYYAETKVAMENVLASLDMGYVVARTSVLYGKARYGRMGFVPWLIEKLMNKEQVRVVTDQKNKPTFTDSLASFLFGLYDKDETGIFHTTGKECISRYDFSKEIARIFGLDSKLITPVTSEALNQVALRPKTLNMATEKVERATGMSPISIEEGLMAFKNQLGL
jgi:dTDP-4-dehydrorhamnose reductase